MEAERWRRVERLFHRALELDEAQRADFLDDRCRGDAGLRAEVASLLANEHPGFMETRGHDAGLPARLGAYRVSGELGRGGTGVVYRAFDTRLERPVALKVLTPALADVSRLEHEARALARFNHPNIATIYGLGETEDGRHYLVLELVEGEGLGERLRRGALDLAEALGVARQIAEALVAAHRREVIHRDLKPDNVIINLDGVVKVLDFGLARSLERTGTRGLSPVVGTPGYMSPEHIRGLEQDRRTDSFAFGSVLYECLTGRRAFTGNSTREVLQATLESEPDWSALPETISPAVRRLLRRCLSREAASRLGDLAEAVAVLRAELESSADQPPIDLPHNLPADLSSFVGRERELADVGGLFRGCRLLTLTGAGGSGKTRLALRHARGVVAAGESGEAWWVELAAVDNPRAVPFAVMTALEMRESPGRAVVDALVERLRAGSALIVLDNCEHLVEACAAMVEELLHRCPSLKIVATSREALGLPGETVFPVPRLSRDESVRLFAERARAARPGFRLDDASADPVARICRRLEGVPLAIELAAARVRAMSPEQIAGRLERSFEILAGGRRRSDERQRTVHRAFRWSYELLDPLEQRLLRQLSVFCGGCTLEAAEAVCGRDLAAGAEQVPVLELLTALVEKSMLSMAGERYRMLETTRQFVAGEPGSGDLRGSLRDRHLDYFAALAEQAAPEIGWSSNVWLARIDADRENCRAALDWSFDGRDQGAERGMAMAADLGRFWQLRGDYAFGRAVLDRHLRRDDVLPDAHVRARALHWAGVLAWSQDDYAAARPLLEDSLRIFRRQGDEYWTSVTVRNLGVVVSLLGNYPASGAMYAESVRIAEQHVGRAGDERRWRHALCLAVGNQAYLEWHVGENEASLDSARKALRMASELEDPAEQARASINAGRALTYLERHDEAEAQLLRALELTREVDLPFFLTYAINFLIGARLDRPGAVPEPDDVALAEEGIELARRTGLLHAEIYGLSLEALLLARLGRHEAALSASSRAIEMLDSRKPIDVREEEVLCNHYRVLELSGRPDEARGFLERAHREVEAKLAYFDSDEARDTFLSGVAVNRQIRRALEGMIR